MVSLVHGTCGMILSYAIYSWWRHQMETFSALLAFCAGNSPVPGEFPTQRPVTWSFDVSFDLRSNKRLSKQSWGWWFETPSRSLWRHCNVDWYPERFQWNINIYGRRKTSLIVSQCCFALKKLLKTDFGFTPLSAHIDQKCIDRQHLYKQIMLFLRHYMFWERKLHYLPIPESVLNKFHSDR